MNAGRNDPCPCGSGKKYKKCCLSKDNEKRREQFDSRFLQAHMAPVDSERAAPSTGAFLPSFDPPIPPPPRPRDPRMEAINARWEEFEEQDLDGKISLFTATLEEPALMDDEMALGMLESIHQDCASRQQRDRFEDCVRALRETLPEIYASSEFYYLSCQFENALSMQSLDSAGLFAKQMAKLDNANVDLFDYALDRLAYFGQQNTLVEVMQLAWPRLVESWDVFDWVIDEFANRFTNVVVFQHLERDPHLAANDVELINALKEYVNLEEPVFSERVDAIAGRLSKKWTMEDFHFKLSRKGKGRRQIVQNKATWNLTLLQQQFLGYLRRDENVTYSKGQMANEFIREYLMDRHAGRLKSQDSSFEDDVDDDDDVEMDAASIEPTSHSHSDNVLCPDKNTLDRFLARHLGFMSLKLYQSCAMFELIPAWLRFLETNSLIETALRTRTLDDLKWLQRQLSKLFKTDKFNPALHHALDNWPN